MPAPYAHDRFGREVLPLLTPEIRKAIEDHQALYRVGLCGPDPFFNYAPFSRTEIGKLGNKYHMQTGKEFFGRVCRMVRLKPSREAVAYLYGVLGHYALDSRCHPFINEKSCNVSARHIQMETEFERYLMTMDGITDPNSRPTADHLRLTEQECAVAASFYPPARGKDFQRAIRNMRQFSHLFARKPGKAREGLQAAMKKVCPEYAGFIMTVGPDPEFCSWDESLLEHYRQALAVFPEMDRQIRRKLAGTGELGREFDLIFG